MKVEMQTIHKNVIKADSQFINSVISQYNKATEQHINNDDDFIIDHICLKIKNRLFY